MNAENGVDAAVQMPAVTVIAQVPAEAVKGSREYNAIQAKRDRLKQIAAYVKQNEKILADIAKLGKDKVNKQPTPYERMNLQPTLTPNYSGLGIGSALRKASDIFSIDPDPDDTILPDPYKAAAEEPNRKGECQQRPWHRYVRKAILALRDASSTPRQKLLAEKYIHGATPTLARMVELHLKKIGAQHLDVDGTVQHLLVVIHKETDFSIQPNVNLKNILVAHIGSLQDALSFSRFMIKAESLQDAGLMCSDDSMSSVDEEDKSSLRKLGKMTADRFFDAQLEEMASTVEEPDDENATIDDDEDAAETKPEAMAEDESEAVVEEPDLVDVLAAGPETKAASPVVQGVDMYNLADPELFNPATNRYDDTTCKQDMDKAEFRASLIHYKLLYGLLALDVTELDEGIKSVAQYIAAKPDQLLLKLIGNAAKSPSDEGKMAKKLINAIEKITKFAAVESLFRPKRKEADPIDAHLIFIADTGQSMEEIEAKADQIVAALVDLEGKKRTRITDLLDTRAKNKRGEFEEKIVQTAQALLSGVSKKEEELV